MKIHFLGTGSAIPDQTRQNTSILLEFQTSAILIDCNGTPIQSFLKARCNPDKLTDVILTHHHVDHIYGIPSLFHGLWLMRKKNRVVRIHANDETLRAVDDLLDTFDLPTKLSSTIKIERICFEDTEGQFRISPNNKWSIRHFRVNHGSCSAIGISIEKIDGSERLVYSGDAIADQLVMEQLFPNVRFLIHDCGGGVKNSPNHGGAREINNLIRETNIKQVFLVHIPEKYHRNQEKLKKYVAKDFAGQVTIPSDLDVIDWN